MASFSELPVELVEHIALYLDQSALYALSQLTSKLHNIATPLLYRHVDLLVPFHRRPPRIDLFCYNILQDPQLGKHVRSLRLGHVPAEGHQAAGIFYLPNDKEVQHRFVFEHALELLRNEALVSEGKDLRSSIGAREYGAYAALLFLTLPCMQRLDIIDVLGEALRPLHSILVGIFRSADRWQSRSPDFAARIASIRQVSVNSDWHSGLQYKRGIRNMKIWPTMRLPGLRRLEFAMADQITPYVHPTLGVQDASKLQDVSRPSTWLYVLRHLCISYPKTPQPPVSLIQRILYPHHSHYQQFATQSNALDLPSYA
jgi:hypothetical protein